jgi:hypothetical protein
VPVFVGDNTNKGGINVHLANILNLFVRKVPVFVGDNTNKGGIFSFENKGVDLLVTTPTKAEETDLLVTTPSSLLVFSRICF